MSKVYMDRDIQISGEEMELRVNGVDIPLFDVCGKCSGEGCDECDQGLVPHENLLKIAKALQKLRVFALRKHGEHGYVPPPIYGGSG